MGRGLHVRHGFVKLGILGDRQSDSRNGHKAEAHGGVSRRVPRLTVLLYVLLQPTYRSACPLASLLGFTCGILSGSRNLCHVPFESRILGPDTDNHTAF